MIATDDNVDDTRRDNNADDNNDDYQNAKSSWHHDTRLDKTQEQRLQDALVNVGSCDVREMLWTASCWFALAPRERDEAMMLSQLTFRESESFD